VYQLRATAANVAVRTACDSLIAWPGARPPGSSLRAKVIVVDDQVALVGSANLTP
jgi:phosphatidylserine/phosphatidylglycerophosphate/cardiolipin synthase-like enzyme